jgi:hypothetical protein
MSVQSGVRSSSAPLATLAATSIAIHAIGLVLYRRVLASPGTTGARRSGTWRGAWDRRLPGVAPGSSAIALALTRLVVRTPRGRSILLMPLLMLTFFGVVVLRSESSSVGPFPIERGLGLGLFVSFVSLIATLPISMNQFAVDGAGLTMTLLSPLSTRQLLTGKAVGIALIAMPPALAAVSVAWLAIGGGHPADWLSLLVALPAILALVAPAAAILSAMFPRVVDMNSIGRAGNAHAVAGFVGLFSFAAAAAPCVLLAAVATRVLERPWLGPLLLLLWCATAFAIARLLLGVAVNVFDRRRESLALLL